MQPTKTLDAFELIEEGARKLRLEKEAAVIVDKAGISLLFGKRTVAENRSQESLKNTVFFSSLLLTKEKLPSWEVSTLATDGKVVLYNPEFVAKQGADLTIGCMIHEALHIVLCHHARLRGKDIAKWQIATDLAINGLILESGFKLPAGCLLPGKAPPVQKGMPMEWATAIGKMKGGLSAEEYYSLLPDPPGKNDKGDGDGDGDGDQGDQDPGGCGAVRMPGDGSESACSQAESSAKADVAMAESVAKQRGDLSAGLQRLLGETKKPVTNWKDELREFLVRPARCDVSWARPNRRWVWQDIYMPGLHSLEVGELVLAIDTSGSISPAQIAMFGAEIEGMIEALNPTLTILWHDSSICHVQRWTPSDGPLVLEPHGGGGTSHIPVFEWVEENGIDPTAMVCFTDMCSQFPDKAPNYPVLWASIEDGHKAPFGRLIYVKE